MDRLRQLAAEPLLRQLLPQLQRHDRRGGGRADLERRRPHLVGPDDRAGLPRARVDPRLVRARRAAARAAERSRRDRLLRRGQDLGAPLRRRRRDLDDGARDRAGQLPNALRPARGAAADLGRQLGRPRLRRLDRLRVPARLPGERRRLHVIHGRNHLEPGDARADRQRRRRAARDSTRTPRVRAGSRSRTTSTAGRRSTSASSGRRTPVRAGAARSCSTPAACR